MAQCSARSKQTKKRCRRPAIRGGNVCRHHGGGAPQVRRRAAERLAALVDPALDTLGRLIRERRDKRVALGAVKDVLDRNGYGAPRRFEIAGGETVTEAYQELNSGTLTEAASARLRELLDRFECGDILGADEQRLLHELRQKAGGRRWLHFVRSSPDGSQVRVALPDNGRD